MGLAQANAPRTVASPEARLIDVYRLLKSGDSKRALEQAESLVKDVPNFQLAQLVYGDLMLARNGRLANVQAVPTNFGGGRDQWVQLRREANLRLAALSERPPVGAVPKSFVQLPASTRHAIAVDATRSRLYLFENTSQGLVLVRDHYVSLGRSGVGKNVQGDQRTPLGAYFITSRLDRSQLQDLYGVGALTLNYPNEHDRREGRTGHGIWLHGVPRENWARTPLSTDGCVVLANEDMRGLLRGVSTRSTPVVIANQIQWQRPQDGQRVNTQLRELLTQWEKARSSGDLNAFQAFYSPRFTETKSGAARWTQLQREHKASTRRPSELKEVSILTWYDKRELMVTTFGLVPNGQRTGVVKRQYWSKEGGQWKIFFEGVIG